MTAENIITTTSNTTAKPDSAVGSVRRMLKNALLIAVRDSVLLKLATVDLLLVVFSIGIILGSLYLIPALAGEPCHTTEELNAFYNQYRDKIVCQKSNGIDDFF